MCAGSERFRLNESTGDAQVDSIKRIAGLRQLLPGLHLLVGHDHTDYQWKHLSPYLSKGWLSEEDRRELSEYESRLFERDGRLLPEAMPRFERRANEIVGTVSEPSFVTG